LKEDGFDDLQFGEMLNNNLNGRCIRIDSDGDIFINYKEDGRDTVGNHINIYSTGVILVGDWYDSNGALYNRGTEYYGDGSSYKFGDNSSQGESVLF